MPQSQFIKMQERESSREHLRRLQRANRRYSGGTTLDGKTIKPRDERIKRNHMKTVNFEARMHHVVLVRKFDRQNSHGYHQS